MTVMRSRGAIRDARRRGQTLVEFALGSLILLTVTFGTFEIARMLLVYTTVVNSARAGIRYAITHSKSFRPDNGEVWGASGPDTQNTDTRIIGEVERFAQAGLLDVNNLTVNVTYPDLTPMLVATPGSMVSVTVRYDYDPWFGLLPLQVPLGTTTMGVITF